MFFFRDDWSQKKTCSPGVAACINIALESMSEYQKIWDFVSAQKSTKKRHVGIKFLCSILLAWRPKNLNPTGPKPKNFLEYNVKNWKSIEIFAISIFYLQLYLFINLKWLRMLFRLSFVPVNSQAKKDGAAISRFSLYIFLTWIHLLKSKMLGLILNDY